MQPNQKIDVDLNSWRDYFVLNSREKYNELYSRIYHINWGVTKWLFINKEIKFSNRILINTTALRYPYDIDFKSLYDEYGNLLLYIAHNKSEYEYFQSKTGLDIEYYAPRDFSELCIIINSCKLFIGSYSAPLAIAAALDVKRIPELFFEF
jgi:hypothetical protein